MLSLALLVMTRGLIVASQDKAPSPDVYSPAQIAKGKSIYKDKCARCHGLDGRGQTVIGQMLEPPDFTEKKWSNPDRDQNELSAVIRSGKGEMPAFGKKLTRQEINYLIAYIRLFNKTDENSQ